MPKQHVLHINASATLCGELPDETFVPRPGRCKRYRATLGVAFVGGHDICCAIVICVCFFLGDFVTERLCEHITGRCRVVEPLSSKSSLSSLRPSGLRRWQISFSAFLVVPCCAVLAEDLQDLKQGRPTLRKTIFKARVRAMCASATAKRVASACRNTLHKVREEVIRPKGAATSV